MMSMSIWLATRTFVRPAKQGTSGTSVSMRPASHMRVKTYGV